MKVIIIGAGLSGLSTAIALRKYLLPVTNTTTLTIKIYERESQRDDPNEDREEQRRRKLGAGLGLQSNGLNVLNDLDPRLKDRVYASGFPCTHFKWKTAGDILLSREYVDVLPISRPLIIDCLAESLAKTDMVEYRTVSKIVTREGQKPMVQFQDGSPDETADLVIGADGVGSVVRQSLFNDNESKYKPQYLGLCGVGGVLDLPLPQHLLDDPCMVFIMGSTGHFGYTGLTQSDKSRLLYWSIWDTALPDRGQPLDLDLLQKQLHERHDDWTDPIIGKCLQNSRPNNIYPIFVMPELPHWGRDGCVLVGDAAHALPPRTGQGASQAFEDAQTLALLLAGNIKNSEDDNNFTEAISRSIIGFYKVRNARVYHMRAKAMAWKDPKIPMSWFQTMMMYVFLTLYVQVQFLMSFFDGGNVSWDLKGEVKRYLEKERVMK